VKMTQCNAQWCSRRALALALASLVGGAAAAAVAAPHGTWVATGSLHVARDGQTATLLANGVVVVAGGETDIGRVTASTEIYDPTKGVWRLSGNLNQARGSAGAALLRSGAVLIAGGCTGNCLGPSTRGAELYNPTTRRWSTTAVMGTARVNFGLVLLKSGKVLAVGGCTGQNSNGCTGVTAAAELFDPASHTWHPTGSLNFARGSMTATLLGNGTVLVAGGINSVGDPLRSAELYNPSTGTWRLTGNLNINRDEHTATRLTNGQVLVAGGENLGSVSTTSAELYNPAAGRWTVTGSLGTSRLEHAAVLLANGNVLVSGGSRVTPTTVIALASAELYNPATGAWKTTGSLHAARIGHTSTVLPSGPVLDAAGANLSNDLASAELYTP
jgi:N-acetylneuraminic acid mutarotase